MHFSDPRPVRRLPRFAAALLAGLTISPVTWAAERTMQTAFGEVKIEGVPTRVVTLGENALDATATLGIKPVGALASRGGTDIPTYLKAKTGPLALVGTVREPSLEAILAQQPDIILAAPGLTKEMYAKLSLIAPTVVPAGSSFDPWEDTLREYAKALDKSDDAEKRISEVDTRVEELSKRMPANTTVSVLRWNPQGPQMMSSHLFVGSLLQDLGLRPNPLAASIKDRPHSDILSLENLNKADADWIFLATLNPDGKKALDEARTQPAFTRLKAAQDDQVVSVDGQIWSSSSGYLAAMQILDDVEKSLAK
ncbi:ABC transporter substrate-binding protein [Bordetella tumulicola]|uniref:ABC transporter substrate-binding protein n=1 Tax=Bordetella tumulicola TaxID=1649133 RepID=UPI0039EE5D91